MTSDRPNAAELIEAVFEFLAEEVLPSASEIRRKPNSPASGSGASANQSSIAGSSCRWMFAVRVTPEVSASRWRKAALGSAKPSAASRWVAASGVSRASSVSSRATAVSSGR